MVLRRISPKLVEEGRYGTGWGPFASVFAGPSRERPGREKRAGRIRRCGVPYLGSSTTFCDFRCKTTAGATRGCAREGAMRSVAARRRDDAGARARRGAAWCEDAEAVLPCSATTRYDFTPEPAPRSRFRLCVSRFPPVSFRSRFCFCLPALALVSSPRFCSLRVQLAYVCGLRNPVQSICARRSARRCCGRFRTARRTPRA